MVVLHGRPQFGRYMSQRLKTWYPFFFAALPVLNTLTRNPGGTRLDDAAVVLGIVLLGCAVVHLITVAAFRARAPAGLFPLIVLMAVFLFYGKSALGGLSRKVAGVPPVVMLVLVLCLGTLGLWWLARRRPQYLDRVNTFFALTGLFMVTWLGLKFVVDQVRARSLLRHSKLAEELARPIGAKPGTGEPNARLLRDVYLIVLDEYANSAVLREQFQFDNRMFEDSLRQLGFTIPALVRSNYVHTVLSLPSLLNFSHLTQVAAEVGERSTDATLPNYLLENNRTVTFLKQRGYRFLFFPSQWWPSTSQNRNADWEFEPWSGFNPGREATRSDFRRSLLSATALGLLKQNGAWDADHIRRTLAALEQVPHRPEPTFAFAHLVSPHWPYVFRADCRLSKQLSVEGRAGRQRAYIEQLQCLNHLLLQTVTSLLRGSSVPPVILLQGDHGTNLLRYSAAKSAASVTPAQARERFGAFGAYYLPDGGGRLFRDTVTMVNVFQKVLSHYHGADIAPAPDQLFVSLERTPYDFVKVDAGTLSVAGAKPAGRGGP
jgi:hypothetical protein